MDLKKLKEILSKAEFSSEESRKMAHDILDVATQRGSITQEEKDKLLGIVDLEDELVDIEAEAMEETASALQTFANEVDQAISDSEQDLKEIEADFSKDIDEVAAEAEATE